MSGAIQAVSPYDLSYAGAANSNEGTEQSGNSASGVPENLAAFNVVGRDNNGNIFILPSEGGENNPTENTDEDVVGRPPRRPQLNDKDIIKALLAIINLCCEKIVGKGLLVEI